LLISLLGLFVSIATADQDLQQSVGSRGGCPEAAADHGPDPDLHLVVADQGLIIAAITTTLTLETLDPNQKGIVVDKISYFVQVK
jgi:hypothetical protein